MSRDLVHLALGYDPDEESPATHKEVLLSELESRLLPLASGLLRLRLLTNAIGNLEDRMMKDLRTLVRHQLQEQLTMRLQAQSAEAAEAATNGGAAAVPSAADAVESAFPFMVADAPSANGDTVAEDVAAKAARPVMAQLRELSVESFEMVMATVVRPVMVLLRRAHAIHHAVMKTLQSPAGQGAITAIAEDGQDYVAQVEARSSDLLLHMCELAQERYMRLLQKRKDVHARLQLTDFVKMTKAVNEFVRDVAHLCPKAYSSLSTELHQHSTEFLRITHDEAKRKLAAIVELEQWKQVQVAPEFQQIADAFSRNQVPTMAESELLQLQDQAPVEAETNLEELSVEGTGYKVVASSLLLLSTAAYYMQCVVSLQTVGAQVAQLLPALLKLFHEITYKQVLHGGAMRSDSAAGLKIITAKHLALASQALGIVLALLPHFKAILAAYMPENQRALLKVADEAAADYESHQDQLLTKLVVMLEERRKTHVARLAQQLSPSEERRRPEPTDSVKLVVKDLVHMHKVLVPLLSRQQLNSVFEKLLAIFDDGQLAAYKSVDMSVLFTRQSIVADVLHLKQEVSKLHLALPNGACPNLVAFAKSLNVT